MSQQFSSEMECRQYHIDLGRGTFALKAKFLQAYVSEQVKAFQDLKLEERAAEERIKLAALAAEAETRAAAERAETLAAAERAKTGSCRTCRNSGS